MTFEDDTYVFFPELALNRAKYILTLDTPRDVRTLAFQTIELYEWAMLRIKECSNERN